MAWIRLNARSRMREISRWGFRHLGMLNVAIVLSLLIVMSSAGYADEAEKFVPVMIGDVDAPLMVSPKDAEVLKRCTGCHLFSSKELKKMDRLARRKHKRVLRGEKVCTECHEASDMCCHEPIFTQVKLVPFRQAQANSDNANSL